VDLVLELALDLLLLLALDLLLLALNHYEEHQDHQNHPHLQNQNQMVVLIVNTRHGEKKRRIVKRH
jgi:hypothetical protein